jgi:hypothetical protein
VRYKLFMSAGLLSLAFAAIAPANAATVVLDFASSNCTSGTSNGCVFNQTYGDQPGLDISYRSMNGVGNSTVTRQGLQYWDSQYGNLTGVAWGGSSATFGVPEITFTLTQPGSIRLNSLQYAGWPTSNRPTSFRVYDLNYVELFNSGAVTAPGQGNSTLTFNTGNTSGLRLQWGPDGYNVGIDNLSFSLNEPLGAVPEPATWLMMIAGFGLIGGMMRQRKTQNALQLV